MLNIKDEKKVEYLELVYDLIFVYIIGRNNSLLHYIENGFVKPEVFLAYILCTLAAIQIWNFTTFYINIYGRNGIRDHIFLFINMYLLYYMADGTSVHWQSSVNRYSMAWALILINIAIQHVIELKNHKNAFWELTQLKRKAFIIFTEAALVFLHLIVYNLSGVSIAYIPILFGITATALSGRINALVPVDFAHLTERAMLYVVFTFGEMIISLASYFDGDLGFNTLYFSGCAFLIVAGLLLSYGYMYNKMLDRFITTNGTGYMMIHVFLIFALNNISVALEFMRDEKVALLHKTVFLTVSFLIYFICLFLTGIYAKKRCEFDKKFVALLALAALCFVILMIAFRNIMYINIAISVLFVFGIFILLTFKGKKVK